MRIVLTSMLARTLMLIFLAAPLSAMAEMTPLDNHELEDVVAREGIAFEWDLRINADEDGNPLASLALYERRIALQFANRDDEWLVLKNIYGRINFPNFTMDAITSSLSPSAYADTSRFVNQLGVPVSPYGKPNILITFPEAIEFYNVTVSGMAVEYGAVPATVNPLAPPNSGFFADQTDANSFLGLRIGNSIAGQPGTLLAEGDLTVFGF